MIPNRPKVATITPPPAGYTLINSLPYTCSVPNGKYALAADLTASSTGYRSGAITIAADGVTIDGCGRTVRWSGASTTQEPRCIWMAQGKKGLTVKNLNINWFGSGLKTAVIAQGSAKFENVHIQSDQGGFYIEPKADQACNGSTFTRCSVTLKNKGTRLLSVGTSSFATLGVIVRDCDFLVEDAAVADGLAMSFWNAHGHIFERCTVTVKNAGGDDVDDDFEPLKVYGCDLPIYRGNEFRAYSRTETAKGQVGFLSFRDNTVNGHGTNGLIFEDNYVWSDYLGAQFGGSGGHLIRRNVIFGGMKARTPNNGWTLLVANGATNTRYESNLIVGASNRTFLFRSGGGGDKLVNNTIVSFSGPALEIYKDQKGQVRGRNNIVVSTNDVAFRMSSETAATVDLDYDLFHQTGIGPVNDWNGTEAHGIVGDPKFAKLAKLPEAEMLPGNFALLAGSPAINKGAAGEVESPTDVRGATRTTGGAVDMGAFEYAGVVTPPPPDPDPEPDPDPIPIGDPVRDAAAAAGVTVMDWINEAVRKALL